MLTGVDIGVIKVYANPTDVPPQFTSPANRLGSFSFSGGGSAIIV